MMVRDPETKRRVDVVDRRCLARSCYQFGFDKGVFTQGVGYTSYHKQERPVCLRRHVHGCPHPTICPQCRTIQLEGVVKCFWCRIALVPR